MLQPFTDLLKVLRNSLKVNVQSLYTPMENLDLRWLAGNYVIIEFASLFAVFAHLIPGSITVKKGQEINTGEVIGLVGHSGNSTAPHLHFQLMDSNDIQQAKGVPCAFREYEVFVNNRWEKVVNGIPKSSELIRYAGGL
jgi:murein DD-endopeptidase MepM/ murein hydrolase activator NlpD